MGLFYGIFSTDALTFAQKFAIINMLYFIKAYAEIPQLIEHCFDKAEIIFGNLVKCRYSLVVKRDLAKV